MNKYKVNVNGTDYEITVELLDENAVSNAPAKAAASNGGETVSCPMPGTILDVKVNVGDAVSEGQVLMILEAMKMENEIMAPCAGKVASIAVTKGATVESGAVLLTIA